MAAREISRRSLLLGAAGVVVGASSGCGGFALRPGDDDRPADELLFTFWATDAELGAFESLARGFEQESGVRVRLQNVPFSQALNTVDTGLRVGASADVFRVTYNDVGLYRDQGVLLDLPDVSAERGSYLPAMFSAVTDARGTFGVPHHTDTTMVLTRRDVLASAGIDRVPRTPEDAWTWEEFDEVCARLRRDLPDERYPAAVNWQLAGAYRWLNWLDQTGGRLLTNDLDAAATGDRAAWTEAVAYTRGLFADRHLPRSSSPKSSQYTEQLFASGTVAMAFVGNFTLPALELDFDYDVTFLPRRERASADIGGNALVAVDGRRGEAAAAFCAYCARPAQQAAFCRAAGSLPTRTDVDVADIAYPVADSQMRLYAEQLTTVRPELVSQVTVPQFNTVNQVLLDQLELAFIDSGPSDADVVDGLLDAVQAEVTR